MAWGGVVKNGHFLMWMAPGFELTKRRMETGCLQQLFKRLRV